MGLALAHNAKWECRIERIISSASKKLSIRQKFKLHFKTLEQIYFSYICRVLEYADVWDGCTKDAQDRLEKFQHEAARLVSCVTNYIC